MSEVALDSRGRGRSPATVAGYLSSRAPRNKGRRYPADPPRVEEIIAIMRVRFWFVTARATSAAGREWTNGRGTN
jgi:hypothetical protein